MYFINGNYTLLWWGQLVSRFGDRVQAIALTWWIIQETGSTLAVGTYMTVSTLPGLVFGLAGGVVADRTSRRDLMVVTDIVRGILILFLTWLLWKKSLTMAVLYGVAVVFSLCTSLFNASIGALMPDLVGRENMVKANSLLQSSSNIVSIAGFALGGVLVALFPLKWLFFANALSFILSGISEIFIRAREVHLEKKPEKHPLQDLQEGLSYLWARRDLLATTGLMALKGLLIFPIFVYLPELSKEVYRMGSQGLGYLNGVLAAGNLAGAWILARRKGGYGKKGIAVLAAAAGLAFLGLSTTSAFALALALFAVAALVDTLVSISVNSAVQLAPPANLRGRVLSVYYTLVMGMQPLAFGAAGLLREVATPHLILAGMGVGLVIWSALAMALPILTVSAREGGS